MSRERTLAEQIAADLDRLGYCARYGWAHTYNAQVMNTSGGRAVVEVCRDCDHIGRWLLKPPATSEQINDALRAWWDTNNSPALAD